MHEFFSPEKDLQLGSQLRREALAARRQPKLLQDRISLAVRSDEMSSKTSARQWVPAPAIFYALAAVLCVALALPALWDRFAPPPSIEPAMTDSLVMIETAPQQVEGSVESRPDEEVIPSQLEQNQDDLALLTADVQAAVDTLLTALPVEVDVDSLIP